MRTQCFVSEDRTRRCISGTGGCILNKPGSEEWTGSCVEIIQGGKFLFDGGRIAGFSSGAEVGSPYDSLASPGEAELTGTACIECLQYGISVGYGKLVVSGSVSISGNEIYGIGLSGTSEARRKELVISGEPSIRGGKYALTFPYNGNASAAISGGTFYAGTEAAIYTVKNGSNTYELYLGQTLLNSGTDKSPKYAFFDSEDLPALHAAQAAAALDLTETVTVHECPHPDCSYMTIPDDTTHGLDHPCDICGETGPSICSYTWSQSGRIYTGKCACGSVLKVTLADDAAYVYNGTPYEPELSVELNGQELSDENYRVVYTDNTGAGTARAMISGTKNEVSSGSKTYAFTCNVQFQIAKAPLSVSGIAAMDRVYDGTDRVEITDVILDGVAAGDLVTADTKNLYGIISGTDAGHYDSVVLSGNAVLAGDAAKNYILPPLPQTFPSDITIRKAPITAKTGILNVKSSQSEKYSFDLSSLCPPLPAGQTFGSFPAAYALLEITLGSSWYAGGASIDGNILTLPLKAARNSSPGVIGTVTVKICSENFEDATADISVIAKDSSPDVPAIPDDPAVPDVPSGPGDSGSSSGQGGGYWTQTAAQPYLKTGPWRAGWYLIQKEAEKAPEKSVMEINMNGTSLMPGSMLAAMQGRDITVKLDMGRKFSWTINGKSITLPLLHQSIDFTVYTGNSIIPPQICQAAGGAACMQLRLKPEMDFGFQAALSIQTDNVSWTVTDPGSPDAKAKAAENSTALRQANLFYYNEASGRLEFADVQNIAPDGSVYFTFTGGGRYAVILSADKSPDSENQPESSPEHTESAADTDSGSSPDSSTQNSSAQNSSWKVTSVKLSRTAYTYSGKAKKPAIRAIDAAGRRIAAKYYTVTYQNNKKAGIARAVVSFRGKYRMNGIIKRSFTIRPPKPPVPETERKPSSFIVKWKNMKQADGLQIQYHTKSDFSGSSVRSLFVKKTASHSSTVRNLKAGKNYYVRIRAYKTAESGGKTKKIYSAWSRKVKTI